MACFVCQIEKVKRCDAGCGLCWSCPGGEHEADVREVQSQDVPTEAAPAPRGAVCLGQGR